MPFKAQPVASRSQLARATVTVAAATLASRVLGLTRETTLAWLFGAHSQADVYVIAASIPLVLFVTVQAAITIIFVPYYSDALARRGSDQADREASNAASVLTLLVLALTLAAWLGVRWVVRAIAPGFVGGEAALAYALTRVTLPAVIFLTWAAVTQAVLNSHQHFTAPALMGIPQNLITITAIVLGGLFWGVGFAIWGVLLGTASTVLVQLAALRRVGFRFTPHIDLKDPALRRMGRLALPVLVASAAQQLGIVLDRGLATRLGTGMVAALNYSYRLEYITYGVLGLAVATVLYPSLSRHGGLGDMQRFKDAFGRGAGLLNFVLVPVMLGLILFRVAFIRVLFQHGVFDARATQATAFALFFFALGTPAIAWMDWLSRSFFALKDTRTPMLAGVLAVAVNVVLMFALVGPLHQGGLAFATAAGWTTASLYMLAAIRRKIGPIGGRRMGQKLARICLAAALAVVPVWFVFSGLAGRFVRHSTLREALALALAGVAASGLYLLLSWFLRVEEVQYARDLMRGVLRRLRFAS